MAEWLGDSLGEHLAAMEAYISEMHVAHVSWYYVLNNHTSTRPKDSGGPLFHSLQEQMTEQRVAGQAVCTINMPCSFAAGDGLAFSASASAQTPKEAKSAACRRVLTMLLYWNADALVFRQSHWKCSAEELVEHLRQLSSGSPSRSAGSSNPGPAVRVRQPLSAHYVPPEPGAENERTAQVIQLLQECLRVDGGSSEPSWFRPHKGRVKPWRELEWMMEPNTLRTFIESRPEFTIVPGQGKRWSFEASQEPAPGSSAFQEPASPSSSTLSSSVLVIPEPPAQQQLVVPDPPQQQRQRWSGTRGCIIHPSANYEQTLAERIYTEESKAERARRRQMAARERIERADA